MKDGSYTLKFARNESIRLYYYQEERTIFPPVNTSTDNSRLKARNHSLLVPANSQGFQDCLEHHLHQSSSYTLQALKETVFERDTFSDQDKLQELLRKGGIRCQVFTQTPEKLEDMNFDKVKLVPSNQSQCTWKWKSDENLFHGGIFNVTLHSTSERKRSLHTTRQENILPFTQNVLMALTCSVKYHPPIFSKTHVTYAIPFILPRAINISPQNNSVSEQEEQKMNLVTWSTFAAFSISLTLIGIISFVVNRCYKNRTNKG